MMVRELKIFRETALPAVLMPFAIYLVAPTSSPDKVEFYVSNSTGTGVRRLPTESDIVALIQSTSSGNTAQGSYYRHNQPTPDAQWVVNHNFGFVPTISVYSVGGVEMMAEVISTSMNQFIITFDQPVAGFATCS